MKYVTLKVIILRFASISTITSNSKTSLDRWRVKMEDYGTVIGLSIKYNKLKRKVKEALELLKMDNPDIQRVIRILEGKEDDKA